MNENSNPNNYNKQVCDDQFPRAFETRPAFVTSDRRLCDSLRPTYNVYYVCIYVGTTTTARPTTLMPWRGSFKMIINYDLVHGRFHRTNLLISKTKTRVNSTVNILLGAYWIYLYNVVFIQTSICV